MRINLLFLAPFVKQIPQKGLIKTTEPQLSDFSRRLHFFNNHPDMFWGEIYSKIAPTALVLKSNYYFDMLQISTNTTDVKHHTETIKSITSFLKIKLSDFLTAFLNLNFVKISSLVFNKLANSQQQYKLKKESNQNAVSANVTGNTLDLRQLSYNEGSNSETNYRHPNPVENSNDDLIKFQLAFEYFNLSLQPRLSEAQERNMFRILDLAEYDLELNDCIIAVDDLLFDGSKLPPDSKLDTSGDAGFLGFKETLQKYLQHQSDRSTSQYSVTVFPRYELN